MTADDTREALEDDIMRRLSSDNPKSRYHREGDSTGVSAWSCIPIRDAVEARTALLAAARRDPEPVAYEPLSGLDALRHGIEAARDPEPVASADFPNTEDYWRGYRDGRAFDPEPVASARTITLHTCWDDHEGPDGTHLDGSPCFDRPVRYRAAAVRPDPEPVASADAALNLLRWVESLPGNAQGQVWVTKDELRQVITAGEAAIRGTEAGLDAAELEVLVDWANEFYGDIEGLNDPDGPWMTQLDHGRDEYMRRIVVVGVIRAAALRGQPSEPA